MDWEPYASPNKGELVAFSLPILPNVRAFAVFYGPDSQWYASLAVRGVRISGPQKATGEAGAKKRAIELAKSFTQDLTQALLMLEGMPS